MRRHYRIIETPLRPTAAYGRGDGSRHRRSVTIANLHYRPAASGTEANPLGAL
jgi:hypothetical protein